jgi:hypothetical protein
MIFQTRLIQSPDLDLIEAWFEKRKRPKMPRELLPTIGVMVSVDTVPVCAGFLYKSDGGSCMIGTLASDPELPGVMRDGGLDALITSLCAAAKDSGYSAVNCSTNIDDLKERFKRHDFVVYDENVTCFCKSI